MSTPPTEEAIRRRRVWSTLVADLLVGGILSRARASVTVGKRGLEWDSYARTRGVRDEQEGSGMSEKSENKEQKNVALRRRSQ